MSQLVVDSLLLVMLIATTAWCILVHRRLKRIGVERAEIASFVTTVEEVVDRAEDGIARLKTGAEEIAKQTRLEEEAAGKHVEELTKMVTSATRVSQRLEASLSQAYHKLAEDRMRAPVAAAPPPMAVPVAAPVALAAKPDDRLQDAEPALLLADFLRRHGAKLTEHQNQPVKAEIVTPEKLMARPAKERPAGVQNILSRIVRGGSTNELLDALDAA